MDARLENNKDALKVSVVIPVYNVSAYIERCIDSVIKQTYTNIECIIVDDVTPDDSIEKCEKILSGYTGTIDFKILHHTRNRGLSASRNTGTEASTGDYLYYLDSDDEITPDCIALLMEVVKQHPDVEMVQGCTKSIPYMLYYDTTSYKDVDYIDDNEWLRNHFYCIDKLIPVNAWNKLLKKRFIVDNALYFKEGLIHEDELWMYQTVKKLQRYSIIQSETYIHYRGTVGSIMTTNTQKRAATHWAVILNEVLNTLDTPCYEKQLLKYCRFAIGYYGVLDEYKGILKKISVNLRKCGCGFISFLLFCFRISYPIVRGRYIRRVLEHFIRKKFEKLQKIWYLQ